MRSVEFAFYIYQDEHGRQRRTPCRLSPGDAAERYPGCQRIDSTVEVRQVAEPGDYVYTTGWQRSAAYKKPNGD